MPLETAVQALRQYGSDVGMAFQIVDDVLDLREGASQLGKPASQDLAARDSHPANDHLCLRSDRRAPRRRRGSMQSRPARPLSRPRSTEWSRRSVAPAHWKRPWKKPSGSPPGRTHVAAASDPETRDMLEQIADIVCERSA